MLNGELVVLGKIVSVHGIRGAVKVYSFTDPIDNILDYEDWILHRENEQMTVKLIAGRMQGKVLVAELEDLMDRDQASELVGFEICIPHSKLPKLNDGEYYWLELQGLKVINQQNELLGLVDHLLETGANDVLVVKPCVSSVDDRERLLPYIDQCVLSIDLEAKELRVDWDAEF